MNLSRTVTSMVRERESATVDELLPHLLGYTRSEVKTAMHHASRKRWLKCKPGQSLGLGGFAPGRYTPGDVMPGNARGGRQKAPPRPAPMPRVSSVWQLGEIACRETACAG